MSTGATAGAAPPVPGSIDASAVLWAIVVVIALLAAVVAFLVRRMRPDRGKPRRG
jgi:hypothetical protein